MSKKNKQSVSKGAKISLRKKAMLSKLDKKTDELKNIIQNS